MKSPKRRKFIGAATITGVILGFLAFSTPVSAHSESSYLERSGCSWGYWSKEEPNTSTKSIAKTWKSSGSCNGHAWLKANYGENYTPWIHDSQSVSRELSVVTLRASSHKTCGSCAPGVSKTVTHY